MGVKLGCDAAQVCLAEVVVPGPQVQVISGFLM